LGRQKEIEDGSIRRRELIHHPSEIIHRDRKRLNNPERLTQGVKGQGNHPFNVGVEKEITGSEIFLR
jgi:hypothetical protein